MDPKNKNRQNQNVSGSAPIAELEAQKEFEENVISIDRVARVVKGGRRFRFRALVVVGNGKGKVGVGTSKGQDVQIAVQKATDAAKKNIVSIALYKGTIPHDTSGKVGGADILLKPAADGTGLIAGGTVRTVLEAAGVKDILSKSLGSSNKINVAYATIAALEALVPASEWITNTGKSTDTKKKTASKTAKKAAPAKKEAE